MSYISSSRKNMLRKKRKKKTFPGKKENKTKKPTFASTYYSTLFHYLVITFLIYDSQ